MSSTWADWGSGVYGNEELSDKGRHRAALKTRLDEATDKASDFNVGRKSGDKVTCRIYGEITEDATAPLGELHRIPMGKPAQYEVTGQIYLRGFATPWTSTLEDLDRLNVESAMVKSLSNHAAKTHNTCIFNELVSGRSFTYVPRTATTGEFNAAGAVAHQATAPWSLWHAQNVSLELERRNVPPAEGINFFAFVSPTIWYNALQDRESGGLTDVKKYASGGAEGILNNEVGSYANARYVIDNHAITDRIGAGTAYGSGFILGLEAIQELMGPFPMHFRANMNLGGNFGLQQAIAWVSFQGWKVLWNYATHGQGSVLHITST